MTAWLALSLAFAALAAAALSGAYLLWPRRQTAEEWILRRRAAAAPRVEVGRVYVPDGESGPARSKPPLRWPVSLIRSDLHLLELAEGTRAMTERELADRLLRLGAAGIAVGGAVGLMLWMPSRQLGSLLIATTVTAAVGLLFPLTLWFRLRRRAAGVRAGIRRRLPRLLTGARVLLESGAATPHMALSTVADAYHDPAADALREALREEQVWQVEVQESLDQVGRTYQLEPLRRMADAFRIGSQHGTQMADLLAEFAAEARHEWHAEYRERMTRAPVLMAVPMLVFWILPLLVLMLLMVALPLMTSLGQL